MKPKQIISQSLLKELFEYRNGKLIRKTNASNNALKGSVAGSQQNKGYIAVGINKQNYLAHRLIWTLLKGEIPEGAQVDHRDGVRNNNCIENLRLALNGQGDNNQNTKVYKSNKSGFIGVYWHKSRGKWVAQIRVNGKALHLGCFDTPEEAYEAYLTKKKELHDFNPIPRHAALGVNR